MARRTKTTRKNKKEGIPFLPVSWQAFISRRITDTGGFVLLISGLLFLAALLSYNHSDPSLNTAAVETVQGIKNWLGRPGAYVADLFIQTLGFGSLMLAGITTIWGWRFLKHRHLDPLGPRLVCAITATIFFTIALARIPAGAWFVHPYLGGSGGTLVLDGLAGLINNLVPGYEHTIVASLSALIACFSFLYACAFTSQDLRNAAAFISRIAHRIGVFLNRTPVPTRSYDVDVIQDIPIEQILSEPTPKREPVNRESRKIEKPKTAPRKPRQAQLALTKVGDWEYPSIELLEEPPAPSAEDKLDEGSLNKNADMLQTVLQDFSIEGEIVSIHPGPVVTLYELEPAPGVKSSRVIGLSDDIARSMSAVSVRCAVVPGRNVIGIEIPNKRRQTVYLRDLLEMPHVQKTTAKLPLILGKDISGQPIIGDLTKMPHLLVAGTTGSGKSVAVNTMILSLLYRLPPEKCRLIMIDPKMLELSAYDDIPHLLSPVVTEPGKAVVSLKWTVQEMENRYRAMAKLGVRNIEGYNARLAEARKKGETLMRKVQTGFDPATGSPQYEEEPMDMTELPYIVVIVDEFADLMLVAGKDVEGAVQRLAQMARAAGIHIIMATQRPSVDVITGVIKANFPTRISFQVTSKIDSRTILGEGGAEQLLGMGDMLYMEPGGRIRRVHGPFVSDQEVEDVVGFLKAQASPDYIEEVTEGGGFGDSEVMGALFGDEDGGNASVDELYDQAVALVARERKASTSFIQRYLQIGYNRAARIVEEMERQGVISPATATGKREVLVSDI